MKPQKETKATKAYKLGANAARNGYTINHNPYPIETSKASWWARGFTFTEGLLNR